MTCPHSVGRHIASPAGSGRREARSPTCFFYSQSLLQRLTKACTGRRPVLALERRLLENVFRAEFIEAAGEAQAVRHPRKSL